VLLVDAGHQGHDFGRQADGRLPFANAPCTSRSVQVVAGVDAARGRDISRPAAAALTPRGQPVLA